MNYVILSIIAYLLGTLPFALWIVKITSGTDIREAGSKNIGARNSYETTGKKWVGIIVLIGDSLKGVFAVFISLLLFSNERFIPIILASSFSVLGHNFNIFLKFKGGRGLATAAGCFAVTNPFIILLWLLMYLAGSFVINKNVHVASVTATIATPILAWSSPDKLLQMTSLIEIESIASLQIMVSAVCFVILLRHIDPILKLIKK